MESIAAILLVSLNAPSPVPIEVEFTLPAQEAPGRATALQLARVGDPEPVTVAAQLCRQGPWVAKGPGLCFILPPTPEEHRQVSYEIAPTAQEEPAFRFEEAAPHLRLFEGDLPVLVYNFGMLLPDGVPENRRRSSYVHPLYGLDGETISDDFPTDHYHHRGLFWSWPKLTVGDRTHDLWAISGVLTRFGEWLGQEVGPVCAVFGVRNGWYVGETRIVEETAWFRVWRAGVVGRAIDADLTWEAQDEPVAISPKDSKGYGGLCLRFGPREETTLTTAHGRQGKDSDLQSSPWADLSARFAGRQDASGAAIFIDADNPGFPNGWCLRHYGFLGVDWPGLDRFTLRPGQPVHVRYRVWVHRGNAQDGQCAAAYANFAEPPDVAAEP